MTELYRFPQIQYGIKIVLLFLIAIIYVFVRRMIEFRKEKRWKTILELVCLCIPFTMILLQVSVSYLEVKSAYENQNSCTITGSIKDYQLVADGAHYRESFQVDDISFSYISYNIDWYYSETQCEGGIIKGNGQFVEIQYVTDKAGNNRILRISEDTSKSFLEQDDSIHQTIVRCNKIRWIIISGLLCGLIIHMIWKNHRVKHSQRFNRSGDGSPIDN